MSRAPRVPLRAHVQVARERLRRVWQRSRRPLWMAARVVMVAVAVAGAIAVGHLAERHVRTSAAFATRVIELSGNERLTRDEVLHAAGLALGQNVFDVGPEEAEQRLARYPWIASAQVHRRLPGSFELRIRERVPAALLALEGSLYLVSDDGTVFKRAAQDDSVDLPVVTGIDRTRFTSDRAFRASILLEIVALLGDYRGAGLWRREPIGEVHVESNDGISLYIGDDATYVRLGRGPFRKKLARLRQVADEIASRHARAAYVYLDNVRRPDRVTVRLR